MDRVVWEEIETDENWEKCVENRLHRRWTAPVSPDFAFALPSSSWTGEIFRKMWERSIAHWRESALFWFEVWVLANPHHPFCAMAAWHAVVAGYEAGDPTGSKGCVTWLKENRGWVGLEGLPSEELFHLLTDNSHKNWSKTPEETLDQMETCTDKPLEFSAWTSCLMRSLKLNRNTPAEWLEGVGHRARTIVLAHVQRHGTPVSTGIWLFVQALLIGEREEDAFVPIGILDEVVGLSRGPLQELHARARLAQARLVVHNSRHDMLNYVREAARHLDLLTSLTGCGLYFKTYSHLFYLIMHGACMVGEWGLTIQHLRTMEDEGSPVTLPLRGEYHSAREEWEAAARAHILSVAKWKDKPSNRMILSNIVEELVESTWCLLLAGDMQGCQENIRQWDALPPETEPFRLRLRVHMMEAIREEVAGNMSMSVAAWEHALQEIPLSESQKKIRIHSRIAHICSIDLRDFARAGEHVTALREIAWSAFGVVAEGAKGHPLEEMSPSEAHWVNSYVLQISRQTFQSLDLVAAEVAQNCGFLFRKFREIEEAHQQLVKQNSEMESMKKELESTNEECIRLNRELEQIKKNQLLIVEKNGRMEQEWALSREKNRLLDVKTRALKEIEETKINEMLLLADKYNSPATTLVNVAIWFSEQFQKMHVGQKEWEGDAFEKRCLIAEQALEKLEAAGSGVAFMLEELRHLMG